MGILDEAIREHLDLKRQHGAEESEVKGLEAEAFGPADRPDATGPPDAARTEPADPDALTRVISPGSSVTAPAGEGDQLDKVFEASRIEQEASGKEKPAEPAVQEPGLQPPPEGDTGTEAAPAPDATGGAGSESPDPGPVQAETLEDPVVEAPGISPEVAEREDDGTGDAGDALEAERRHLAGQPTEHYDVDAAIAEENQNDLLSESRLADELDRALEGPDDEAGVEPTEPGHEFEPETAAAPEPEAQREPPEVEGPGDEGDGDPDVVTGEVVEEEQRDLDDAEFFDQDDPLEGTPDFLEETPEHDRLWFEQKEPKDFDFGD